MELIKCLEDKNRALDILEQAFSSVAAITWMIQGTKNKRELLREFLAYCYHESAEKQGAYLTSDRNGVVFFYNLRSKSWSVSGLFRKLYLMFVVVGMRRSFEILKTRRMIDNLRPKTGWYGWFLATEMDVKGIRAAYEIKRDMYKMADATGEAIYVETTIERIMVLYRRIGFYEYARRTHPYNGLNIWFMRRDPKTLA
jgi:hypothetical protein